MAPLALVLVALLGGASLAEAHVCIERPAQRGGAERGGLRSSGCAAQSCDRAPSAPTVVPGEEPVLVSISLQSGPAAGGSLTVEARDSSTGAVLGEANESIRPFDARIVTSLPALGAGARAALEVVVRDASGAEVHRQCADVASDPARTAVAAPGLSASLGGALKLHASCRLQWTFEQQHCGNVSNALVAAFKDMSGLDCGSGEKCLYSLEAANATAISGKHETPKKHYKDDLTIGLQQHGTTCTVDGFSTSETWYAVLDDGTNYCNLHNLAAATGLAFSENVEAAHCTQVKSANCAKY